MKEYWDLYDKDRKMLPRKALRGEKLKFGEYHLVVNAWIKNNKGEFLITQRSEKKKHPLMWECTGGSALKGETSIDAAIREIKEELGIDVDKETGILIGTTLRYFPNCPDILDVWVFKCNVPIKKVKIQEEEVSDAMWATPKKIREIYDSGNFEANPYIEDAIKF